MNENMIIINRLIQNQSNLSNAYEIQEKTRKLEKRREAINRSRIKHNLPLLFEGTRKMKL